MVTARHGVYLEVQSGERGLDEETLVDTEVSVEASIPSYEEDARIQYAGGLRGRHAGGAGGKGIGTSQPNVGDQVSLSFFRSNAHSLQL